MVDLHRPVKVMVNGRLVLDDLVPIDKAFMPANFQEHPDRERVYVAKLTVTGP